MNIPALIKAMAVLMFALAVGFIGAKFGILDETSNRKLSSLVINITSPLRIVASVLSGERVLTNLQVLELTGIAGISYIFFIATSFLVVKLLHASEEDKGLFRFMYIFSNIGFIGYPIAEALFGKIAGFYISIFVMAFHLVMWSYGVSIIGGNKKVCFNWKVFRSPCVIAALIAYIIYFSGLRFPAILGEAASYIGDLTSPIAMLVVGCSLAPLRFGDVFQNWRIYILAILKMIVCPMIAYFLLKPLVNDPLLIGIPVLIAGMPVATNTTIVCYQEEGNTKLASSGVFLTTLMSSFTIPLMMWILFA